MSGECEVCRSGTSVVCLELHTSVGEYDREYVPGTGVRVCVSCQYRLIVRWIDAVRAQKAAAR